MIAFWSQAAIFRREGHRKGYLDGHESGFAEGVNRALGISPDDDSFIHEVAMVRRLPFVYRRFGTFPAHARLVQIGR